VGNNWVLKEVLPPIGFESPRTVANASRRAEIARSLREEMGLGAPAADPYFAGACVCVGGGGEGR